MNNKTIIWVLVIVVIVLIAVFANTSLLENNEMGENEALEHGDAAMEAGETPAMEAGETPAQEAAEHQAL